MSKDNIYLDNAYLPTVFSITHVDDRRPYIPQVGDVIGLGRERLVICSIKPDLIMGVAVTRWRRSRFTGRWKSCRLFSYSRHTEGWIEAIEEPYMSVVELSMLVDSCGWRVVQRALTTSANAAGESK